MIQTQPHPSRHRSLRDRQHLISGLLFTSPAIIGLLVFTAYPLGASLYYSFCSYSVLQPPRWTGLANYRLMALDIAHHGLLFQSVYNTLYFAAWSVPLGILVAYLLAILLNQPVRGLAFFRTLFYIPSVVPVVASSVLWLWLFNPQYGLINIALQHIGVGNPPGWLADPAWSKPALILMSLWGVGNSTVILLAGLQGVPAEYYEAAELDGASPWQRTIRITTPLMSPYLLFLFVMGLIGAGQYFTQAWVMTNGTGSPANSTLLYPMYLFQNAFQYFKMGYACAMAWFLFIFVAIGTLLLFKTAARYVTYGE